MNSPRAVAFDPAGNIYIADYGNQRIRKITLDGNVATWAGTGTRGYSGDGGLATAAGLNNPISVACDAAGNLYIADSGNNRIRRIDTNGIITTIAGTGAQDYLDSGDDGPALKAALYSPQGIAVGISGAIFVTEPSVDDVRQLTPSGSGPVLTIVSAHLGNFAAGQDGVYTLSVANAAGAGPTSGTVTVNEILPLGLSVQSLSGPGWTCNGANCTRSDPLRGGVSYPPITVAVSTPFNATGQTAQLTNQVIVSGGGAPALGTEDFTLVAPFRIDAVVNGASFAGSPCPGSIATIFGSSLAAQPGSAASVPLPLSIGSTTVLINGIMAPVWYVSPTQINFQMPAEVAPGPATVVVNAGGGSAPVFSLNVPLAAPGIITYGNNLAVAENPDGNLVNTNDPAVPGGVITVYMTGLGPLNYPVATNSLSACRPVVNSHSSGLGNDR